MVAPIGSWYGTVPLYPYLCPTAHKLLSFLLKGVQTQGALLFLVNHPYFFMLTFCISLIFGNKLKLKHSWVICCPLQIWFFFFYVKFETKISSLLVFPTAPNPCLTIECLNGGVCVEGNCDCSNTAYSGPTCGICKYSQKHHLNA